MNLRDYRDLTRSLADGLVGDERVLGLVALGSMAERDYGPDEWSDHDFFVVTRTGEQDTLRSDLAWLPRPDDVVLAFRETDHGLRVLYEDGHLLEFAVFDLDELRLAAVNRYRVLLDRGGVAERMADVARDTARRPPHPREDERFHFGLLVADALVGAGRALRGEAISGDHVVKSRAVRHLVVLLAGAFPSERAGLLDDLDPLRRFDLVHPELAKEIELLLRAETVDAAIGLLDLAEHRLRSRLPDLPWHALEVVRERLRGAAG